MKIIKFYRQSCGPCKVLERNFQTAGIEHESIDIEEVDEAVLERYKITGVPTTIIEGVGGNILKRYTGLMNVEDLKKFCNEFSEA
jgi:glutaredoxin